MEKIASIPAGIKNPALLSTPDNFMPAIASLREKGGVRDILTFGFLGQLFFMQRKARMDASGPLHHIIVRGIEDKAIFKDRYDRDSFLEGFGTILTEISTPCYAWVLMSNQIVKTGRVLTLDIFA